MWSIFGDSTDTRLVISKEGAYYIAGKGDFALRFIDDEDQSSTENKQAISRISNIKKEKSNWLIVGTDYEPADFSGPVVRTLVQAARDSPLKSHGMVLLLPAMLDYGLPDSLISIIILPESTLLKVQRLFEMVLMNNLKYSIEIMSRRFWSESENQQASSWRDFESGIPHLFSTVEFSITRS
jgi:hypothetical protein